MPITILPASPSRSVPSTFSALADAFIGALPGFVTQANVLEVNVNAAEAIVVAQAAAATIAMAAANFKGAWSALTGAAAIPFSVSHLGRYWMLITATSNITADVPGTSAKWQEIGNVSLQNFNAVVRDPDQGVALTAAASGSSGITVADNANINFGVNNFALVWKGSLPDWTPGIPAICFTKIQTSTLRWYLQLNASGEWSLVIQDAAGNLLEKNMSIVPVLINSTIAELCFVVIRETALAAGSFSLYSNGVLVETAVIAASATPPTATNTGILDIMARGDTGERFESTTIHAYTLNFAPTAAEVLDMYRNGIPESWKWGSQKNMITAANDSDFSGGTIGNWEAAKSGSGTVTYNTDAVGGVDNKQGLITVNEDTYNFANLITSAITTLVLGKEYLWTFNLRVPAANTQKRVNLYTASMDSSPASGVLTSVLLTGDTWTKISYRHKITGPIVAGFFRFGFGGDYAPTTGDKLYFDNVKIQEIGATLALTPEGIQPAPGQWLDSSDNKLHAMLPATGSSLTRYKEQGEVRWINTWAGTHEAQYVGGVNQNVLPPDNIRIDSITMVVVGATGNVILGDGSATDKFVASVALAAYLDCTVASRNHDGTNRKLVISPDANLTGTINTILKYTIL